MCRPRSRRGAFAAGVALLVACGGPQTGTPSPSCPQDRTIVLNGQDDVAGFAGCETASAVSIRTGIALDLAPLGALREIRGDLTIGPSVGLARVSFAELRRVGGSIVVASNSDLHSALFPRLELANRIEVDANVSLATVSFPALTEVPTSLVVTASGALQLLDLSALTTVGNDLVITDNPTLVLVEADQLVRAGAVRIENNDSLPPHVASALASKTAPP